jgi:hypothetical protein
VIGAGLDELAEKRKATRAGACCQAGELRPRRANGSGTANAHTAMTLTARQFPCRAGIWLQILVS